MVVAGMAGLGMVLGGASAATAQPETTASSSSATWSAQINGWAENVAVLPGGDLVVTNFSNHLVQRIDRETKEVSTIAQVASPGGLAVDGDTLYVTRGNHPASLVDKKGGIVAIDLPTGDKRSVITGLGMANGLAQLPGGDLVYTVTMGGGTGVHRIDPETGSDRVLTTAVATPNGIAVGPDGHPYVGSTLHGSITRVDADSGASEVVAGTSVLVDDFGFRSDGTIVGASSTGAIDELDPATGRSRPLRAGYVGATSAKPLPGGGVVVTTATGRVLILDLT